MEKKAPSIKLDGEIQNDLSDIKNEFESSDEEMNKKAELEAEKIINRCERNGIKTI